MWQSECDGGNERLLLAVGLTPGSAHHVEGHHILPCDSSMNLMVGLFSKPTSHLAACPLMNHKALHIR